LARGRADGQAAAVTSYTQFFSGTATVASALLGLLFVALSVAPERLRGASRYRTHRRSRLPRRNRPPAGSDRGRFPGSAPAGIPCSTCTGVFRSPRRPAP